MPSLTRAAIPTACALLGALVMPHNLFLHSALVHSRPVEGLRYSGMPHLRSTAAKKVGWARAWRGGACCGRARACACAREPSVRCPHSRDPPRSAPPRPAPPCPAAPRLQESVFYYSIESALALVVTLFVNVCVVSTFAKGFFGTHEGAAGRLRQGRHRLREPRCAGAATWLQLAALQPTHAHTLHSASSACLPPLSNAQRSGWPTRAATSAVPLAPPSQSSLEWAWCAQLHRVRVWQV